MPKINPLPDGLAEIAGLTGSSGWKFTGRMRWATIVKKPRQTLLLQQEWVDEFSGRAEWRDVPDVGVIEAD